MVSPFRMGKQHARSDSHRTVEAILRFAYVLTASKAVRCKAMQQPTGQGVQRRTRQSGTRFLRRR
jgi:hypothetical protein